MGFMVSNCNCKGGGLAMVVGAVAGVQAPRFGLEDARGPSPLHGKMTFPVGFMASKVGQLAVVVAAAASGESDGGGLPSTDCEVKGCMQLVASGHK